MQHTIDVAAVAARSRAFPPPEIVDVRSARQIRAHPVRMPRAIVREAQDVVDWAPRLEHWRPILVYCADGGARSRDVAQTLRALGREAMVVDGGLHAFEAAGLATAPRTAPTRWVTRERPKIDRIACPWLVRRFIDSAAQFDYVPACDVMSFAQREGATPFDMPGTTYGHVGALCSFDAFLAQHGLQEPGLAQLATIVRAADTGAFCAAAQSPGLLALSVGLAHVFIHDHAMLTAGLLMYDALFAWCRHDLAGQHGTSVPLLRTVA